MAYSQLSLVDRLLCKLCALNLIILYFGGLLRFTIQKYPENAAWSCTLPWFCSHKFFIQNIHKQSTRTKFWSYNDHSVTLKILVVWNWNPENELFVSQFYNNYLCFSNLSPKLKPRKSFSFIFLLCPYKSYSRHFSLFAFIPNSCQYYNEEYHNK